MLPIQFRRGTASAWTTADPVLAAGEPGFETDTGLQKTGDGSTAWTSLPYDAAKLPAAFTAGSVLFVGATDVITQDNATFFWDDANNRLGIGTASPGSSLEVGSTLGSELAPALSDGNWTLGAAWESPIAGGVLNKNANGVNTATPSAATTIVAGTTYKAVLTVTDWSVGSATVSLGGISTNVLLNANGTYTVYVTANTTDKLIITPSSTSRFKISAVSIKEVSAGTFLSGGNLRSTGTANLQSFLGIGPSNFTPLAPIHISDGQAVEPALLTTDKVIMTYGDTAPGFAFVVASDVSGSHRGVFKAVRARGTLTTPTVPINNDTVLSFLGAIYDGVNTEATGIIEFYVDGTVSENVCPMRISFVTSETSASARVERMSIKADGSILFGRGNTHATPPSPLLRLTNGSGTNIAGGHLTIRSSLATGNAATGDVIFEGANAGASGSTLQTATTRMIIKGGSGNVGIGVTSPTAYLHLKAGTATANTAPLKLTAGTINTTPESGAMEFDGNSLYFTQGGVRRYVTLGNDIRVTSDTVTNTVTETTIHTSAVAANELKVGRLYKLTLLGKTTTANASQFYTLRFKMGGTTLLTKIMTAKTVTDEHFRSESYITIRTIGAGGTYAAHAEGVIGDEAISVTPVTGSVDTTVSEDMTVTLQWDAANAGNVFTVMQSVLEVIG